MNLLTHLRRGTRRIEQFRQASEQAPIRQNAARALDGVAALLAHWQRLNELLLLPLDLAPTVPAGHDAARTVMGELLQNFDTYDAGASAEGLLRWANSLPRHTYQIERLVEQVEEIARQTVRQRRNEIANAAFLAQELGVDGPAMHATRDDVEHTLQEVECVLERRAVAKPELAASWTTGWSAYEDAAGVQASLHQAALPAQLAGTMQQLLERGNVALADIDPEALISLAGSPALARLCSIQLRKDDQ